MFVISDMQLDGIGSELWRTLLQDLINLVQQQFPPHVEALSDIELYTAIETIAARGADLGFLRDDEIEHWVELSIIFGAFFDSDRSMAWAGELLADPAFALSSEKLDFLDNAVRLYSMDVFEDEYGAVSQAALERFADLLGDRLPDKRALQDPAALMRRIWPEKFDASDPGDLTAFLSAVQQLAGHHGFDQPGFQARFAVLAFMLGHRFDIDPLFPSLRTVLAETHQDQHARLLDLQQRALSDVVNPRLSWARM
jgi:hypothetical protein